MDTQFKKGAMDICVLAILKEKDCYGYELVQKISKNIMISEGTLYPILRRLKNEGSLTTWLKESNEGPSRKYYTLTKGGMIKEKKLRGDWNEFVKKVNKILK